MFSTQHFTVRIATVAGACVCAAACHRDPNAAKQRYIASGDHYAAGGKYSEAAVEYRNAVNKAPLAGDARQKLADTLLKLGDAAHGIPEYVRAADLLPDDASVQVKAGNLLLLAGRFDDAKVRAEKVLQKTPRNVEAQLLLAYSLAATRKVDEAVQQIEDALRIDPERGNTYASLGALELSRGRRDAAEQAFQKAIVLEPRSVSARVALAHFYWLTERQAQAEQALNGALEIEPKNPLTNRALADFYLATNRRADAEQPLKTVFAETKTASAGFALADYYAGMNNDEAAASLLQSLQADGRVAALATVRLAALDYKRGRKAEAYTRVDGVLAHDVANLEALLLKTTLLMADGKRDDALASAATAVQRHADSTAALFALGRVQAATRQLDAAVASFNEVLRLNPRATAAKVALANIHLAQARTDTSMTFAQEALASEPGNADARLVLVRDLLARGDLSRAATELKPLSERFPDSAAVHTQHGMLLGRSKDLVGARREFERALQIAPANLEAFGGLVALDLSNRNFASARARVDERLKMGETAPLLALAAKTYAAGGDLSGTERLLRRAIAVDGSYMPAYSALGSLFVSQKRLDSAREEFELLAARSPNPAGALTMVGILSQEKGDLAGARDRFEQALQKDPDAAVAANNLAWIYAEHGGNLDIAMQLAQTAQKHLGAVPEVNDTLGFIYYKKNLISLAISTLRSSVEKEPSNPEFQYHLGLAYSAASDAVHAKQALERALQLNPKFEGADRAREALAALEAVRR